MSWRRVLLLGVLIGSASFARQASASTSVHVLGPAFSSDPQLEKGDRLLKIAMQRLKSSPRDPEAL